jgi:SAM-dependent methyltransferase
VNARVARPGAPYDDGVQQDELSQVHRQAFGEVAEDYDRFRPEPPDDALDWLLPPAARQVLELGAGTGLLTRRLLARGLAVRAIEPDPRMRAVLAERSPGAEVVAGQAEDIAAADGSMDVVIAASAWHWVDEERAVPEVARVLRPGGALCLLWSGPDRSVEWLRTMWAGGVDHDEATMAAQDARRRDRFAVHLGTDGQFDGPTRRVFDWNVTMRPPDLVGLTGTYSAMIGLEPAARQERLAAMARFLERDGATAGRDLLAVPMRCLCWRARRR